MYAGIDIGTTSVKLLVLDESGKILFRDSQELPLYSPNPGWYEQNPDDWWEAVKLLLSKAKQRNIEPRVIGLTGQMHSLVLLDDEGKVLRPAILWNDQRCYEETKIITEFLGGEEKTIEKLGNPVLTGFTAPKILWVKNNEPEIYKKAHYLLLPKDFIAWKLTGEYVTEPSDASGTSLYSVRDNAWCNEVFEIFSDSKIKPPKIVNSSSIVGQMSKSIVTEIGLEKPPYIVAGGADNACAALGMNAFNAGSMVISVGTSGTVILTNKEYIPDLTGKVHTFRHVINDVFYHMGVILSATFSLDWFSKITDKDVEVLIAEIADFKPCKNGVFFLPYLSGERTPHRDPNAKAVIFGLSGLNDRSSITQAVLEGVAFALRDCKDSIEILSSVPTVGKITGGGSRSELWIKIIASALNMELETMNLNEGAVMGAVMLAGISDGADVEKWNTTNKKFIPEREWINVYQNAMKDFRELYKNLKALMSATSKYY